jgi:hypothetical protein
MKKDKIEILVRNYWGYKLFKSSYNFGEDLDVTHKVIETFKDKEASVEKYGQDYFNFRLNGIARFGAHDKSVGP